ncbi:hypothetical protein TNCV_2773351 [Trichonephila clavipes]|nr:hypothetical protein TNCV_2773351 [Trichonephila clavipes]
MSCDPVLQLFLGDLCFIDLSSISLDPVALGWQETPPRAKNICWWKFENFTLSIHTYAFCILCFKRVSRPETQHGTGGIQDQRETNTTRDRGQTGIDGQVKRESTRTGGRRCFKRESRPETQHGGMPADGAADRNRDPKHNGEQNGGKGHKAYQKEPCLGRQGVDKKGGGHKSHRKRVVGNEKTGSMQRRGCQRRQGAGGKGVKGRVSKERVVKRRQGSEEGTGVKGDRVQDEEMVSKRSSG